MIGLIIKYIFTMLRFYKKRWNCIKSKKRGYICLFN